MSDPVNSCVLSIDVEDWFHILDVPSSPRICDWDRLPSRVEKNFIHLLNLAAEQNVRCTCFFVGWVAKRHPHLVHMARRAGHEIASHGWAHRLAYELSPEDFYQDALRSKLVLEDISGCRVLGYRSAGFSLSEKNLWVFDGLVRAGYTYDSSVFPAQRSHGGWQNGRFAPYRIEREEGTLLEFPITIEKVLGIPVCFFGGGYLRFFPLPLIRIMTASVLRRGRPAIFYVHPREIDPSHPRLPMGRWRSFKSYVNLSSTEPKIRRLLAQFKFTTLGELTRRIEPLNAQPVPVRAVVGYEG